MSEYSRLLTLSERSESKGCGSPAPLRKST